MYDLQMSHDTQINTFDENWLATCSTYSTYITFKLHIYVRRFNSILSLQRSRYFLALFTTTRTTYIHLRHTTL